MNKDPFKDQLDRKKIYVVRFALLINILVATGIAILLLALKINGQSILKMVIEYYLKKR